MTISDKHTNSARGEKEDAIPDEIRQQEEQAPHYRPTTLPQTVLKKTVLM